MRIICVHLSHFFHFAGPMETIGGFWRQVPKSNILPLAHNEQDVQLGKDGIFNSACLAGLIGFVWLKGFFGQTILCSAFLYSNHLSPSSCFAITPVNASLFRMQWHPWLRDLCLPSWTLNVWIGPVSTRRLLQPSLIGSRQIRLKQDEGFSEGREDEVVHTGWTSKSGLLAASYINENQSYCMHIYAYCI